VRVFFGFGAIDVYGPNTRKNTGPYSFLNLYVSLRNNFANDMRSKKTVWLWGQEHCWFQHTRKFSNNSLSENVSYASSNQALLGFVAKLVFQPCIERVRILKKLPWNSIFSSDKLFPVGLSFC